MRIVADGKCTGRKANRGGYVVDQVMEVQNYQTELREFDGVFEISSGKLIIHHFCNLKSTSCSPEKSMLIYSLLVTGVKYYLYEQQILKK